MPHGQFQSFSLFQGLLWFPRACTCSAHVGSGKPSLLGWVHGKVSRDLNCAALERGSNQIKPSTSGIPSSQTEYIPSNQTEYQWNSPACCWLTPQKSVLLLFKGKLLLLYYFCTLFERQMPHILVHLLLFVTVENSLHHKEEKNEVSSSSKETR